MKLKLKDIRKAFGIAEDGSEILDTKKPALPVGYKHPMTLEERMKLMIKSTLSNRADEVGLETFDEANDFGEDDDDKGIYPDEDDQFAPNDPYMEEAVRRIPQERLKKASEAVKRLSEGRVKGQRRTGQESEIKADKTEVKETEAHI